MAVMRLYLHHVGAIADADIRLDGITVLAGENNTGKSTIGKALYAIIKSLAGLDVSIANQRRYSLRTWMTALDFGRPYPRMQLTKKQDDFVDSLLESKTVPSSRELERRLRELRENTPDLSLDRDEDLIDKIVGRMHTTLSMDDSRVTRDIVRQTFSAEFKGQENNIYHPAQASVRLATMNDDATITLDKGELPLVQGGFGSWNPDATLVDDPHLLESEGRSTGGRGTGRPQSHRDDLWGKLCSSDDDALSGILTDDRIGHVLDSLNSITQGEAVPQDWSLAFRRKDDGPVLDFHNVSDGKKTFIQLLALLHNGALREGDVLILDEPEIHLHPSWQLRLAELLIGLRHEFGLTILLSTHSPYFLNALEVFSRRSGLADQVRYYLSQRDGDECHTEDVTGNIERIYGLLAAPLDELNRIERES